MKFSAHRSTILVKDLNFFIENVNISVNEHIISRPKKKGNKLPLHATLLTFKKGALNSNFTV